MTPAGSDAADQTIAELFRLEAAISVAPQEAQRAAAWRASQLCTHLMASRAMRDGWTGRVVPQRLSGVLASLLDLLEELERDLAEADRRKLPYHFAPTYDSLARIVDHCAESLELIFCKPRRRYVRTRTVVPLWQAREFDAESLIWLSRQPGRTIEEKLGRNRSVLAVMRTASLNVPENRVTAELADGLVRSIRWRLAGDRPAAGKLDRRLRRVARLCRDGLQGMGLGNFAAHPISRPNNALLSDPAYRRIWQARNWLTAQHKDIGRALAALPQRLATCQLWVMAACLIARRGVAMDDKLVIREAGFDAEEFGIRTLDGTANETVEFSIERTPQAEEPRRTLLRLALDQDRVLIEERALTGSGAMLGVGGPRRRWLVMTRHSDADGVLHCAFALHGDKAKVVKDLGVARIDGRGLKSIADRVAEGLLRLPAATHRGRKKPADLGLVGLDCNGVTPRIVADGRTLKTPDLLTLAVGTGITGQPVTGRSDHPFEITLDRETWLSAPGIFETARQRRRENEVSMQSLGTMFDATWSGLLARQSLRQRKLAIAVSGLLPEPAQRRLREAARGEGWFAETWLIDRSIAAALGWQAKPGERAIEPGDMLLVVDAEFGGLRMVPLRAMRDSGPGADSRFGIYWLRDLTRSRLPPALGVTATAWLKTYLDLALKPQLGPGGPVDALAACLIAQGEADHLFRGDGTIRIRLPLKGDEPKNVLMLKRDGALEHKAGELWCTNYSNWLRANAGAIKQHLADWRTADTSGRQKWHILYAGRPFHLHSVRSRMGRIWASEIEPICKEAHIFVHDAPADADALVASGCCSFLERHHAHPESPTATWRDQLPALYLSIEADGGFSKTCILPKIKTTFAPGAPMSFHPGSFVLPKKEKRYLLPVTEGENDEPAGMSAMLEPPGFPWKSDLRVDLEVDYRYAQSDYQLRLLPARDAAGNRVEAPFTETVARWIVEANIAPEFKPAEPRSELAHLMFQIQRTTTVDQIVGLSPDQVAALRHSVADSASFLGPVGTSDTAAAIAELGRRATEIWAPCLEPLFRTWLASDTDPERKLAESLASAFGLLRLPLPADLQHTLAPKLRSPVFTEQNKSARMLGRMLRKSEDHSQVVLLREIFRMASRRREQLKKKQTRPPFDTLNPSTAALGLILVNEPGFLPLMQVAEIKTLLGLAEAVLQILSDSLHIPAKPTNNGDDEKDWRRNSYLVFRNVGEILAGLLQLRAGPERFARPGSAHPRAIDAERLALVEAGSGAMYRLARLIYENDAMLRRLEAPVPLQRLSDDTSHGGEQKDTLSFLLYRLLAGHDPQRLIRSEVEEA
jgi:hypothetical protein